jgi:hypothetical protein
MVSENFLRDAKTFYYLVENEESCFFTIIIEHWHILDPLCEVVYYYNDITMPPVEAGWNIVKSIPHLVKGSMQMTGNMGARCTLIF